MSVKVVTPSDAASAPNHPDHARWVKEQTLKREVDHANLIGLSYRDAENRNLANLYRLDLRKQMKRPARQRKPKKPEPPRNEEHAKIVGVTRRAPKIRPVPKSSCNWCGLCRRCKREGRLQAIMAKARQGDEQARRLVMELVAMGFAAQKRSDYKDALGRELPFSRLKGHDRNKAITAGAEWVCDRSVSFMGQWA